MSKINLITYTLDVLPDGNLATNTDNINPDEFLKFMDEHFPEHTGAPIIHRAMVFLLNQLKMNDEDLNKHIKSLL